MITPRLNTFGIAIPTPFDLKKEKSLVSVIFWGLI